MRAGRIGWNLALTAGIVGLLGVGAVMNLVSCKGHEADATRLELADQLRSLADTQDAFAAVASVSRDWVVSIQAREEARAPRTFLDLFYSAPEKVKGGSGIVVDATGWILTNRHVVEGATSVTVTFADGTEYKGVRYKAAKETDLAFVKIDGPEPFEAAPLGDSDAVRVGDWAIAIGSPFSFDQTLTVGVISAKSRKIARGQGRPGYEDYLQTDAAINAGNSGGPLLNLKGEVIGVNTAIYSPTRTYAGIGFAIPINRAKDLVTHLDSEVEPDSPGAGAWLGVTVRDLAPDEKAQLGLDGGLVVLQVEDGSPAAAVGLRAYDVLLGFGGRKVATRDDLIDALTAASPGDQVQLQIWRGRALISVPCRLAKRD